LLPLDHGVLPMGPTSPCQGGSVAWFRCAAACDIFYFLVPSGVNEEAPVGLAQVQGVHLRAEERSTSPRGDPRAAIRIITFTAPAMLPPG
jgi:hypothetical protein